MPSKWVPLEASPDVFNEWARSLGLPDHPLSFQDLFSLDSDFLSFIPLPVKAVLLLFPSRGELHDAREKEEAEAPTWEGDDVWWIKQTIPNACGSIGLLHALLNLPDSGPLALKEDSPLMKFKEESLKLDPEARAKLLDDADFFTAAHTSAAQHGQSAVPEDLDVDTHFIAFIEGINSKGEKRVVELDGGRKGPFDRGDCTSLLHVFNEWAKSLGLPEHPLSFQDLLSLDSDFLSYVPQPVKAVLLLFPDTAELNEARKAEEEAAPPWEGNSVWWVKQTIPNACGSIGLLHALLNLPSTGPYALSPDSPLVKFKEESSKLDPAARAKCLENADFFKVAHTSLASNGQSSVRADLTTDGHFIAFVEGLNSKGERRVVELSGGRNGPFDHGECASLLHDVADVVRNKYIARAGNDLGFNMIVLAGEREA